MASNGFTFLETIVVLVISTLFVLFSFATVKHFNSQKLNAAAAIIAEDIRLTQQLNMKQDGVYTMIFDYVNERYYIKRYTATYKKVDLPTGIDLVFTNFDFDNDPDNGSDNRLFFNTRGEPVRINGVLVGGHLSLKDKNDNFRYVIVASITGRVRIDTSPP